MLKNWCHFCDNIARNWLTLKGLCCYIVPMIDFLREDPSEFGEWLGLTGSQEKALHGISLMPDFVEIIEALDGQTAVAAEEKIDFDAPSGLPGVEVVEITEEIAVLEVEADRSNEVQISFIAGVLGGNIVAESVEVTPALPVDALEPRDFDTNYPIAA